MTKGLQVRLLPKGAKNPAESYRYAEISSSGKWLKLAKEGIVRFVAIEEDAILTGRDQLARLGFYVETTSAVVWDAIHQVIEDFEDPIVAILTGSGLKNEHP